MSALPSLEELARLPAVVEQLLARVADLEAQLKRVVNPDELVTVAEAARLLDMTPQAIYKLIQRGHLTRHTVGRSRAVRVRRGDLVRQ